MDYQKIYDSIISKAKSLNRKKGDGNYYESHHIIPKSNNNILLNGGEINLKPIYTGIFVDKDELIKKYPPIHKNIYYHHSTIEFKPQDLNEFPKGKEINVKIIGRLTTDKVDVLLVENQLSKKKNPHITLSTSEGVLPMESDLEIEQNIDKIIPLNDTIKGVYDVFYEKKFEYNLREVYPDVFLLEMTSQYELASVFAKCQAFYEWDDFRGKKFNIKEFYDWYNVNYPDLKPYAEEFYGFNVPSDVIYNCYEINDERTKCDNFLLKIISEIEKTSDEFYLIGAVKGDERTINHELAHAYFWANEDYRNDMTILVNNMPNKDEFLSILYNERGYGENVLIDEAQAFMATGLIVEISEWEEYRKPFIERFNNQKKLAMNEIFDNGGQTKQHTFRVPLNDVKKKVDNIQNNINDIRKKIKWHEGKRVKYPVTKKERDVINDSLIPLRKEMQRIYDVYTTMKKKKQKTVSDSELKISGFDIKTLNHAVSILNDKYLLNYHDLNKTQTIDDEFHQHIDFVVAERNLNEKIFNFSKMVGDVEQAVEYAKIITDKNAESFEKPYLLLQNNENELDLDIIKYDDYKENIDNYSDYKIIHRNNAGIDIELQERTEKLKREAEINEERLRKLGVDSDVKQAITDLITLDKYSRLTQEEGEYLYFLFKNYENLIDEFGEYVAKIVMPKDKYEESAINEIIEGLEAKQYIYFSTYDETAEAYQIAIDFINSVRGRVQTIKAKQSGMDLFPETDLIQNKSKEELEEALSYLEQELINEPENEEIKGAIDYIKSELEAGNYKEGGKIKYYQVNKDERPVLKAKLGKVNDENFQHTSKMLDNLADRGYSLVELNEDDYRKFDYKKVNPDDISEFMKGIDYFNNGGKIEFDKNKVPSVRIYNYAIKLKKNHPEIWKLGGNQFGNQAFKNLEKVIKRGYWLDSEKWMFIKWRGFVARHKENYRIEGVIAMLKWIDTVDKGWDYMKEVIEEEIKKKSNKFEEGSEIKSEKDSNTETVEAVTENGLSFDFNVHNDLNIQEVINIAKQKSIPQNLKSFTYKGVKYTLDKK